MSQREPEREPESADEVPSIRRSAQTPQLRPVPPVRPMLARREKEVLIAWIHDDSKERVARRLHISTTTVRTLLQRVRAKYAAAGRPASTKAALVARALQDGLVKIDDL